MIIFPIQSSYKFLGVIFILFSCNTVKHSLPSRQVSIAINSPFRSDGINDSNDFLQKNITKVYDKILDSLSSIYGYIYFPNYRLGNKRKVTFILRGKFGTQNTNSHFGNYFVKGTFFNAQDSLTYPALGVYNNDSAALFSEIIRPAINDKIKKVASFPVVPITLKMSGTLPSLVPCNHLLNPEKGVDSLMSFSINNYVSTKNRQNKKIAIIITNLMNNILVFNQHAFDIYLKPKREIKYNYYPNYRAKTNRMQKANYNIAASLVDKKKEYELILSFAGPQLNLIAPTKIDTVIHIERKAILNGDYSDVMITLSKRLKTFTWQQSNLFKGSY